MPHKTNPLVKRAGHLIFAAGRIATEDHGGLSPEARIDPAFPYYGSSIKRQTRYILTKLADTFKQAGTSFDHVVKAQVFQTDLRNFNSFDEVWREFFPKQPPCRATVGMGGVLAPECLVAIDLTATDPFTPGSVCTSSAPRAPVNYSESMVVGDFVFASGLMASDYKTGVPAEAKVDPAFSYYGSNIKLQTRYILNNFKTVLASAGVTLREVVKAYVYLKDLRDFSGYDEVWKEFFPVPPPRTIVGVPDLLVRDALVEIDVIAARVSTPRALIEVSDVPHPLSNDAQALRVGNLVFASGALATDFKSGIAPEARVDPAFPYYGSAIKRETKYILVNLGKIFEAAGTSLDHVVKAQVFLTNVSDFIGFDETWQDYFRSAPPPRTVVQTTGLLVRDNRVQIDLIASMPD